MEYWVLWFIGIAITIGTRITINRLFYNYDGRWTFCIERERKPIRILMNVLACVCIILVGGIANAKWIGMFVGEIKWWGLILVGIIPAALTYLVGFAVLGLEHFESKVSHIIFIVVFIISIIGWTIPIGRYNQNIEVVTENKVISTTERKLLYFCNIPVQEVSGSVSGTSVLGNGSVSGTISTSDELSFWYANGQNEGLYGSAKASNSKIVFILENESPYVEVVKYGNYTTTINHNNGQENTVTNKTWYEYTFYLPEAIMQYPLS